MCDGGPAIGFSDQVATAMRGFVKSSERHKLWLREAEIVIRFQGTSTDSRWYHIPVVVTNGHTPGSVSDHGADGVRAGA